LTTPRRVRQCVAEALGTFLLVFFGCGAIMVDANGGGLGDVGVSVAFGLVVAIAVVALGNVSGAHINPAVTLALAATRHTPWATVPGYWAAQLAGAIAAAIVLRVSLGDVADLGATTPSGSDAQSFLWEAVMTAMLLAVIVAVITDVRIGVAAAAAAIGGTIGLASLVGGPISGASLNPARSLGPALVSGELGSIWIYLTAPFVGAVVGALGFGILRQVGRA
jgi:MIP family channel proteins